MYFYQFILALIYPMNKTKTGGFFDKRRGYEGREHLINAASFNAVKIGDYLNHWLFAGFEHRPDINRLADFALLEPGGLFDML